MLSIALLSATPCIYADQVPSAPAEKYEQIDASAPPRWRSPPRIYENLPAIPEGTYKLTVMITADREGKVIQARISSSSTIPVLDHYVVTQVSKARLYPYGRNGVARPFQVEQPYIIMNNKPKAWWKKLFGF